MDFKQRLRSSNKLCIFIQDGECDGEKFLKLISEGADINFKNPLENGNTPLHLAVEGSKADWVELLLKSGCDTSIVNDDGKTANVLAQEIGDHHVSGLLKPSFKKIARHLVKEVNFADFEAMRFNGSESVLEIKHCPSFKGFVEKSGFLKNLELFFVIIVNVTSFKESDLTQLNENCQRPLILQVNSK